MIEVWRLNKKLFVLFLIVICLTLFTIIRKIEMTPLFVWSHYSSQHTPEQIYPRSYIRVNGKLINLVKLPRSTREMIQIPIEQLIFLKERNFKTIPKHIVENKLNTILSAENIDFVKSRITNSDEDTQRFMHWLARYVGKIYELEVKEIEIGRFDIRFVDGEPKKESYRVIEKLTIS